MNIPKKYQDPEKYRLLDSGAVYDLKAGRICDNLGGKYSITSENARTFLDRRREVGLIAQLRGLASAEGIELGDDAELHDIVHGAASAVEALTKLLAQKFKESDNIRGMGEVYSKLIAPLLGDTGDKDGGASFPVNVKIDGGFLRDLFKDAQDYRSREVIEGSVHDSD